MNTAQLIEKLLELLKPQLVFHGITVTKEVAALPIPQRDAPYLMGTAFCLLNQAVSALQIKTPPRTLMIHVSRTADGDLSIEVNDNARPMSHSFRDEWLRLLSPISRLTPGGGRIALTSSVESGNRAQLLFPLVGVEGNRTTGRCRQALVIDDSQTSLNVMRKLLEIRGCNVDTVDNGYKGLLWLRQKNYDLVFLDLNMPGIDGPFLFTAISQELPEMIDRIIVASGSLDQHKDFLEKNRIITLAKPILPEVLYSTMDQVLESADKTKDWRASRHSGRALVLVQDESFLRLVDELLLEWGYDLEWVNTWYKGLYKLTTSRFDLVFLDMDIPGISDPTMMKTVLREVQKDASRFVVLKPQVGQQDVMEKLDKVTLVDKPIDRNRFHRAMALKLASLGGV